MTVGHSFDPILPVGGLSAAPDVRRKVAVAAAYVILGALTLSPLLWAAVPPLVDYPDHLARMWILLHAKDIPALAQNYVVDWRLLPNLAMDLTVPALAQILPLEAAGRMFIAATMALLVLATAALHRALHGRVGLWPLCSLLFVYNAVLFWGFLNFLFTLGLALLMFSGWIASARWRLGTRVLLFSPCAALLLVFHLFAFGVYGLLVASYEFGNRLGEGRRLGETIGALTTLLQFVPAAALWLASLGNAGPSYTEFGSLGTKLYAVLAPWDFGMSPVPLDGLILLGTLGFLLYAASTRALKLSPVMRLPILTLIVATALMPHWLNGSAAADLRLPVVLSFVIIASIRPDPARQELAVCFAVVVLELLVLRIWAVSENWREADRQFVEFRALSRSLPEGARLLVVQDAPEGRQRSLDAMPSVLAQRELMTYWHMPALAVIDRSAFIPYLFTGWTPVRPTPRNAVISESQGKPATPAELAASAAPRQRSGAVPHSVLGELRHWRNWPNTFDFVLWINVSHEPPVLADRLQLWASGSFFRIYRIARP
jgi:hypothetical protein